MKNNMYICQGNLRVDHFKIKSQFQCTSNIILFNQINPATNCPDRICRLVKFNININISEFKLAINQTDIAEIVKDYIPCRFAKHSIRNLLTNPSILKVSN